MKVLHVMPSLSPQWGGPVTMIAELSTALRELGVQSTVFSTVGYRVGTNPIALGESASVRLFPTGKLSRLWVGHSPGLSAAIEASIRSFDLVHVHELWHHPLWSAFSAAARSAVPFVLTPHGQLDPWALGQKALKKRLFSILFQRRVFSKAAAIHVLTPREEQQVREYCALSTRCVIPNATRMPAVVPDPEPFHAQFPHLAGRPLVLFLGRLHPQKGVDILIESFALVAKSVPGAQLAIVGPDQIGLAPGLQRRCEALGIDDAVSFTGPLYNEVKQAALAAATLFVLPSRFEGQSKALLEAMAAGLPSVVTPAANSPDVSAAGAGLVVPLEAASLGEAIATLLANRDMAGEMGRNARHTVEIEHSWPRLAGRMVAMYQAALKR